MPGSSLGKGKGVLERPEGSGVVFILLLPGALAWGSEGRAASRAGWADGVGEQKPALAASTPLREAGRGPRDKGSSEVEKIRWPGADRIKWA